MKQDEKRALADIQEIAAGVAEVGSKLEHLRGHL